MAVFADMIKAEKSYGRVKVESAKVRKQRRILKDTDTIHRRPSG
ncbi:MAG TPA: hypothetical protein DEB17_07555 [Chlorobaculum sp.]|uniref:Uncharacterized protein n=1 Tax=Chlorobaculum tepidum (strain ATCC 49652 / DSM 12025 / NBRC 103806 / TLS) TaxID=194439 RepID=Q8KFH0_CHLTE|nr:hypothetical protein CT0356 [Chlorobaculum tepidum TLS]HBU23828.1 hypothetical protein [Chlorobaculum sp.]